MLQSRVAATLLLVFTSPLGIKGTLYAFYGLPKGYFVIQVQPCPAQPKTGAQNWGSQNGDSSIGWSWGSKSLVSTAFPA